MHLFYLILLLLASLSNSVLLFLLRKRILHSSILGPFGALLILINIWAIPQFILISFPIEGDLFVSIDKISAFGYVFIPLAFSLFSLAYSDRLYFARSSNFIYLVLLPSFIFLYLAWNTNLIEVHDFAKITETAWGYSVPVGPFFPIFAAWFELNIIYFIMNIFRMHSHILDKNKKKQSFWLIVAMLIPWIFGTITNAVLPALHIASFPVAMPLTSLMAILIVYAIVKYGLFEMSSNTILSNIGNGVISVNKQQQIVQINNAAKTILGLRFVTVLGKSFNSIILLKQFKYMTNKKTEKQPLQYVLSTGNRITSQDFTMITKNKKHFSIECTISPIIEAHEIVGATIVFRDMSKEKEVEKSKNEFISIASHELKTPLTSVIAFSQLLERSIQKSGTHKEIFFINEINKQLQKMKDLIEDLLNVSKIESGIFILNKKVTSLNTVLSKTLKEVQAMQTSHHIIQKGRSKQKISIDTERIHQVLLNLITNAIKYSPKAKDIIVEIKDETNGVSISVQDFGIGIPQKDKDKIFHRFYRSSTSQSNAIGGFGLGLYICAAIVKNHNGTIRVDSKVGKGSTFSFFLPS